MRYVQEKRSTYTNYKSSFDNGNRINSRQWSHNEYTTMVKQWIHDNGYTMNTRQWLHNEYTILVTQWIHDNGYTMNTR